ncbi:MAG: hypothetical protein NZ700_04470 [Gemmataceae bacterium]|nr:hypothetical protein [Gemmataceae bacterium]MDW8266475.1 hypothetical protein [Gemmataceae bacterium]
MIAPASAADEDIALVTNPWPALLLGLSAGAVAFVLGAVVGAWYLPKVGLFLLALVSAGVGVWIRPRAPEILAVAALTALLVYWAMDFETSRPETALLWDSAQLVVGVMAAVAAVACLLVLVPRAAARAVVSVLVLLHFGGILTAVFSVPTPGGDPPAAWLPNELWLRFYRPYLQFVYLNNAYHFYSPEPGPATLLWARVEYTDGSSRWIKVPSPADLDKDPLGQQYYRRLALTETLNSTYPTPVVPDAIRHQRVTAGQQFPRGPIPLHPYFSDTIQYKVPTEIARRTIASYARHIARHSPHPHDPELPVVGVKMYRVVHNMMRPAEFLRPDVDPLAKFLFVPYYLGEFDADGNLKDPNDPLLYWMIPIVPRYSLPPTELRPFQVQVLPDPRKAPIVGADDYLTRHAGSSPWEGDR